MTDAQTIQRLSTLLDKVDAFVNGPEDQHVSTSNGPLKTMAGIAADVKKTRAVQFIPDYASVLLATSDATLVTGDVVRVPNVGYFQKNNVGGFDKVSYSDLYDLRDVALNPFNSDFEKYSVDQPIAEIVFDPSSIKIQNTHVKIELNAVSNGAVKHYMNIEYDIHCACKELGEHTQWVSPLLTTLWSRNDLTTQPSLSCVYSVVGGKHVFTVSLITAKIAGVPVENYDYTVYFNKVDTKSLKVIRNTIGTN